ncbi:hypothetical protein CCP3SC1_150016 [Gammaproteobacteria bacterium]
MTNLAQPGQSPKNPSYSWYRWVLAVVLSVAQPSTDVTRKGFCLFDIFSLLSWGGRGEGKVLVRAMVKVCGWQILLLAVALTLNGCLGSMTPSERLFRLSDPVSPKKYAQPLFNGVLAVETFQARGMLARERTILYRDLALPNETQFHPNDLWEEPPAAMLQSVLSHCLVDAGLFEGVIQSGRYLRPRYSLNGTVDRVEQRASNERFDTLIRIDLAITDGDADKIVLSGSYQAIEPANDGQMETLLPAFDRVMTRICGALTTDLEQRTKAETSKMTSPKVSHAAHPNGARGDVP